MAAVVRVAERTGLELDHVRFSIMVGEDLDLAACNVLALRDLQPLEFQNTVGDSSETHSPQLGTTFSMAYGNVKACDRSW